MLNSRDIQLMIFGAAATIDTAVLIMLIERRNRRRVILPVLLFVCGAWLLHCGTFVNVLVSNGGAWSSLPQTLSKSGLALGLLLMPSAMLHAWLRHRRDEAWDASAPDRSRAIAYLPVLLIIWVCPRIAADPNGRFIETLSALMAPYLIWSTIVSALSVASLLRRASRIDHGEDRVLSRVGAGAILMALALQWTLVPLHAWWPRADGWVVVPIVLAPLAIVVGLAWAVLRFHLFRLVLRRSAVYGVIVVSALLIHHLLLAEWSRRWSAELGVEVALIEGFLVLLVLVAWRPARERASEALGYLLGERVHDLRLEARKISVELSGRFGRPRQEILAWFVDRASKGFDAKWVGAWLVDEHGELQPAAQPDSGLDLVCVRTVHADLRASGQEAMSPDEAFLPEVTRQLYRGRAVLLVRIVHPQCDGLVVLGERREAKELSDEAASHFIMLVEHLGVTLNNSRLQRQRLDAESRAHQHQKLSMLGMVASSIAHEVKNPLSSIKTLVTVMEEEADGDSKEDLVLIRSEVDRLADTVSGLLGFARPSVLGDKSSVKETITSTLRIMRHLADRKGVRLEVTMPDFLPRIPKAAFLRDILFNLVTNAIDAVGRGGAVSLSVDVEDGSMSLRIQDNGTGIPASVSAQLYQPFSTSKEDGTGLGLYLVRQRVDEMRGSIECLSAEGRGTEFTLRFPTVPEEDAS